MSRAARRVARRRRGWRGWRRCPRGCGPSGCRWEVLRRLREVVAAFDIDYVDVIGFVDLANERLSTLSEGNWACAWIRCTGRS